ncbi:MAG: PilZ domain-containing protein [Terriglobia bacterium]
MPDNTPQTPRRWERRKAAIPISLMLKTGDIKPDDSATTVDISLHGAKVRTRLALVPDEWVGFVPKGEFAYAIPSRVVWVREYESSDWNLAGLEFINTLGT